MENRITFEIKTQYYLELLTRETMKLLGSDENKITEDKNGESLPHLEITEVVLALTVLLTMIINKIQEFYIDFFQIKHLLVYWKFHQQILSF